MELWARGRRETGSSVQLQTMVVPQGLPGQAGGGFAHSWVFKAGSLGTPETFELRHAPTALLTLTEQEV